MSAGHGTVAVVGAGAVGTATALRLAERGWRVRLVDPAPPGSGASTANAGILAVSHVTPIALPGIVRRAPRLLLERDGAVRLRWPYLPRLLPWLARFAASARPAAVEATCRALSGLMADAVPAWARLLPTLGRSDDLVRAGFLFAYRTEAGLAAMEPELAWQARHGVAMTRLAGDGVRAACPALDPAHRLGVDFPAGAHLRDPAGIIAATANRLRELGGEIAPAHVEGIEPTASAIRLRTDGGPVDADRLVLAAGAWARPLAADLGARVPLDTERGYWVTLPRPGVDVRRPLLDGERGITATPMAEGIRLTGKVEFASVTAPPAPRHARSVLAAGRRLLPGLDTSGWSWGMGCRPSVPDSRPVLGPAPGDGRAVFAFGHGHIGLTTAARTAEIVADVIDGRDPGLDLTPFAAERFR